MRKLILIPFFVVLFLTNLNAQVYQRGYYIDLNKDTIKGELFEELPYALANEVVFRKERGSEIVRLKPSEIDKFYIYRSATTYQSVDYSFKHEGGNTVKRKHFAKLILSGYYSLYKIEFNGSPYVERVETRTVAFNAKNNTIYVLKKGIEEHQLELTDKFYYKEGKNEPSNIVQIKQYLHKLHPVVADCPETLKKLEQVEYSDKGLIDIVLDYNVCKSEDIPNVTFIEFNTKTITQKRYLGVEYAKSRPMEGNIRTLGNGFGVKYFSVNRKDNKKLSTILSLSAGVSINGTYTSDNVAYSNLKFIWQYSFLKHSEVDVYGSYGIGIKGIYVPNGRDQGVKLGSAGEFGVGVAYNSIRFDTYLNFFESGFRASILLNETTTNK